MPVRRRTEHVLPQTIAKGATSALRDKLGSSRSALALVVTDVDGDGVEDLLVGYDSPGGGALLLQRGLAAALAPTLRERALQVAGQFVAPYDENAEVFSTPVRPDLIAAVDLTGGSNLKIAVAAKTDSALYLLAADGKGGLETARRVPLSGKITSLNVWRNQKNADLLIAGICGEHGCGLQVVTVDGETSSFLELPAAPTSVEIAHLTGGSQDDLLVLAGQAVLLLNVDSLISEETGAEKLPIANAVAATSGHFIYSYQTGPQLAVLDGAATLHIFSRGDLNPHQVTVGEARTHRLLSAERPSRPRLAWIEVEAIPNFGPVTAVAQLKHGHFSGTGLDDIVLMAAGQYVQLSHPSQVNGAVRTSTPIVTTDSTGHNVIAAFPARLSPDARLGMVTLSAGKQPQIALPPTYRNLIAYPVADATPTSASLTDCINGSSTCSLRSAVAVANQDASQTGTTSLDPEPLRSRVLQHPH